MPINFPNSPVSGQTYAYNSIIWSWNSSVGAWERVSTTGTNGVTGPTGATGATGPVGDYVSFWNGLTGAVTFTNYVSSFNGATGDIEGVNSFAGRTGSVLLYNTDITDALGFTPVSKSGLQTDFENSNGQNTGIVFSKGSFDDYFVFTNTGVLSFNGNSGDITFNDYVQTFGGKTGTVGAGITSTQILYWNSNDVTGSNNFTFDGTDVVTLASTGHFTGRLLGPVLVPIKNLSGGTITKGTPVYAVGSVGASGEVEVDACDASNSAKMPAIGLADATLGVNGEGHAVVFGNLQDVNTAGYSINGTVYVAPGGGLTGTKPTGANDLIQNIGRVTRVHATTGDILVSAIGRSNDVPNILQARSYLQMPDGMTAAGLVKSFNGLTGAVTGVTAVNAGSGVSVSGTTNVTITNTGVTGFNGATGNVTGVTGVAAGTGISISGTTRPTITNTGVQSWNGLTGVVSGVTTSVANTFTATQSFSASPGISSGVIYTSSIAPVTGLDSAGTLYLNCNEIGEGGQNITIIGDYTSVNNGTYLTVDDTLAEINLGSSNVITLTAGSDISLSAPTITASGSALTCDTVTTTNNVIFGNGGGTLKYGSTALTTTTANQTIATITVKFPPSTTYYRTIEFTIQASTASAYEALKLLVIHDGTNTYNTQYGIIRSGGSLGTYSTTISGNALLLRVTPTTANTTYKVVSMLVVS